MADINELLQIRAEALHSAEKASDGERREFLEIADKAAATIRQLGRRDIAFSHEKPLKDLLADLTKTDDSGIRNQPEGQQTFTGEARRIVNQATGRECRIYTPNDSYVDETADIGGVPARNLDVWRLLSAIITGDKRRAPDELRALGVGNPAQGGYLVPDLFASQIIQASRPRTAAISAGATLMKMDSVDVTMAGISSDPTASWVGEHQALTESELAFRAIKFHARKGGTFCKISKELALSSSNLDQVVREALSFAVGKMLDTAALYGDGAGEQPLGIINTDDVQSADKAGAAASMDDLTEAYYSILEENADERSVAMLYNAKLAKAIGKLKDGDGKFLTTTPGGVPDWWGRVQKYVTNNVTTDGSNQTHAFFGEWKDLIIGHVLDGNVEIAVSEQAASGTSSAFTQGEIWIRILGLFDVALTYPSRFYVVKNALVS